MNYQEPIKSTYPWLLVALLWVVAFLNYFDRILITSMRDPLVAEFTLTDAQYGFAIMTMLIFGLAKGFNDANLMPVLCQVIDGRYIATGYGFLNFLSTIIGGFMVYAAGSLKDANIDLSIAYQLIAVVMLLATWSLFLIKPVKDG